MFVSGQLLRSASWKGLDWYPEIKMRGGVTTKTINLHCVFRIVLSHSLCQLCTIKVVRPESYMKNLSII